MDQVKEILRQAIRYRFWIAVGIALLLPVIAYAVGSGPVKQQAEAETGKIKSADTEVKKYASGVLPNSQYKPMVEEKKEELSKDVNTSWQKLYARQAPLLTWPARVQDRFQKWGRKWPENVDASAVQEAIIEYVNEYPAFVTQVYQTFQPFDPVEGTGIVAAPTQELLLRPAPFDVTNLPELGKVWAAQERLWIQRTLLQVVADVNKNAKSWDSAYVKQINLLEVGNPLAEDQVSLAKGVETEEAPAITNPAAPPPPADAASSSGSGSSSAMEAAMRSSMGGGGAAAKADTIFYIKSASPTQYKVLPFEMTVLVEQNHIQDFLVALENSPMAIQVNDFEMAKPAARVAKPKKGENMGFGMMAGMDSYSMMMMANRGRAPTETGFGGANMAYQMAMMRGSGMGGPAAAAKKGVDVRGKDRAEDRKKEAEEAAKRAVVTVHDPYYNVVEVTVYGQARFYNPPTEPTPEPSQATAATPAEETPKAEGETKPAETSKTEEAKTETPKTEPEKAKTEEPKAKEETPKAEAPKAKEETPKAEEPKAKDEPKKS